MGVISNKRFKKLYGKDIFIYPFSEENLKGASYNLTASKVAYYEEKDEKGNKKVISALEDDRKIICKPNKILYIQTEESIYVSNRISGTYHSKVGWISKGLSPISTTLDPCYFGTSLITIMNLSESDIKINVGDTFCTLIFNELSKTADEIHDNIAFRKDISSGRIYDFSNLKKIKKIKKMHELNLLNNEFDGEKRDILKNLEEKNYNLVKKFEENNNHANLAVNYTYFVLTDTERKELEKLKNLEKIYKNILEQQELEIDEIQSEYKEKMVEWFEEPFRRNKAELINKIRSNERERKKGKREKICLILGTVILTTLFAISLYLFSKQYNSNEKGAIIIGIITAYITILTLISKKIVEFMLLVIYIYEAIVFRYKRIC